MIVWSIQAALSSELFDVVIVSTDDPDIAAVARAAGAEVPFVRPAALADDHAVTADVVAHALTWSDGEGWPVEGLCCVYATAPFITSLDLQEAAGVLEAADVDYVFAAGRYAYPVHRALVQRDDGGVQMLFPEHTAARSQDLPTVYHDAGQFYWGRSSAWREGRPIFSERSRFVQLPAWRVQDIDTPEDWTMAEHLFEISTRSSDE